MKWEYKTAFFPAPPLLDACAAWYNEQGCDGWEAVGVASGFGTNQKTFHYGLLSGASPPAGYVEVETPQEHWIFVLFKRPAA